jgi:hypothetical protein
MACKKSLASINKNTSQGQTVIPFVHSSCLLQDDSAGRIARELWWMGQEFSSVNIIISPWFSMSHIYWGWTTGLLVATVQRRSLTPHQHDDDDDDDQKIFIDPLYLKPAMPLGCFYPTVNNLLTMVHKQSKLTWLPWLPTVKNVCSLRQIYMQAIYSN